MLNGGNDDTESRDESVPGTRLTRHVPRDFEAMKAGKVTKRDIGLNDQVDGVYLALYSDEKLGETLRLYLDAIYPEQAVEGDLRLDDSEAARMIRAYAKRQGNTYLAKQKLSVIVKALNVVLRRYHISRKDRREG